MQTQRENDERVSQTRIFKVTARMVTVLTVEVEAHDADEAWDIAQDLDGGSFSPQPHAGDWVIDAVAEVLSPAQRASIEAVHLNTSCTEAEARAFLEANGWDRTRAIVAVYTAMPHARPRSFLEG